jgi:hypothetical protein
MGNTASSLGYNRNIYFREGDPGQTLGDALVVVPGTAANPGGMIVPETGLWSNCPLISYLLDQSFAVCLTDQFIGYNAAATTGDWVLTQATAGSAAISTSVPGALLINSGATTQGEGVNLQRLKAAFLLASGKDLWFETSVQMGTSLNAQVFIGLAESNTALITSNALASANNVGWSSVTGTGALTFNTGAASTEGTGISGPTLSTSATTLLGFYYSSANGTVQQYVNGVATGAAISTNIPSAVMYPSFVCQCNSTTQPTMTVRGYRVFQLR